MTDLWSPRAMPPGRALEVRTIALGVMVSAWVLLRSLGEIGFGNAFTQGVVVFAAGSLLGLAVHRYRPAQTLGGVLGQALAAGVAAVLGLLLAVLLLLVVTGFEA